MHRTRNSLLRVRSRNVLSRKVPVSGHFAQFATAPSRRVPSHIRELGSKMVAVGSRIVRAKVTGTDHKIKESLAPFPFYHIFTALRPGANLGRQAFGPRAHFSFQ